MSVLIILAAFGLFGTIFFVLLFAIEKKSEPKPEKIKIREACKRIGGTICQTPNKCRKQGCQK